MIDIPLDVQIWDAAQCGEYLKCTKEVFLREVRHTATFPAPLKNFNTLRPRWSAKAVIAWGLRS